jgi:hypothetical protein
VQRRRRRLQPHPDDVRLLKGGTMASSTTPEPDESYWEPCEYGPIFIEGVPCCPGHAKARAQSGDLGWWSNTVTNPIAKGYG